MIHQHFNGTARDTTLGLMYDDLTAALAEDEAAFKKALAANDHCELGRILRAAAERCAERYAESENGQREIDDLADMLADDIASYAANTN